MIEFKAGLMVPENESSKRLVPDPRPGTISITPIDDFMFSFTFSLQSLDTSSNIDLILTAGDASFHIIPSQQGQVIGLKLASSGSKYLFWIQDTTINAANLFSDLNSMINDQVAVEPIPKQSKSEKNDTSKIGLLAKGLASVFGHKKPEISFAKILSTDAIMDACETEDIQSALLPHFPPGYEPTKQSLRNLVSTPYFQQAASMLDQIMASESAPAFLAQFGLLDSDNQIGTAALIRALLKKHQK